MSSVDLDLMRRSGRILAETLEEVVKMVAPGITAYDLSAKAEEVIRSYVGAVPAFLGYNGFPATACVSVNEEVVHAIPLATRQLKVGDIVSVDCGVVFEGHFSDACRTVPVGQASHRVNKLLQATEKSLYLGIEAAKAGNRVGDISYAVQRHVQRKGFSVNLDFTGHGIGLGLHLDPPVPNYGPPGVGPALTVGMCLAIEPVVFDGNTATSLDSDGWTVRSMEGNLSAHFEDTIIITEDRPEIITRMGRFPV